MNPDQLWETTMNPETRTLIQLTMEDVEVMVDKFEMHMGKKADLRKEFMANFEIDTEDLDG
jgi:DNA gyrase/topoisomerase IV subunit B